MSKGRFALLMLLVGSTATSGCVAAAVPVLAAGAIGKKQFFGKKDEESTLSAWGGRRLCSRPSSGYRTTR